MDTKDHRDRLKLSPISEYTEEEKEALREKRENPDKMILCPRCGSEIKYEEYGNSSTVYCEKKDA